jgi:hypothetical protein
MKPFTTSILIAASIFFTGCSGNEKTDNAQLEANISPSHASDAVAVALTYLFTNKNLAGLI